MVIPALPRCSPANRCSGEASRSPTRIATGEDGLEGRFAELAEEEQAQLEQIDAVGKADEVIED